MFNYKNLSDYDFEELCCDIMSKKLGVQLRTFANGKDGGIDATDDVSTHNIIVQAKHYINSSYSALYNTLKLEVNKVDNLKPNQYYVCCAKELTPGNIKDIYNLFSDYMKDSNNVIDLKVIDIFLKDQTNNEILMKHYKLWLESTQILGQISNRNIFIDCESFMDEIEKTSQYFVKTRYYDEAIKILDNNRILLLLGLPGVGKTVTTKMLALYYATQGYCIRYTTDGEIINLKKVISESEDQKELIVLDDCLGQAYFKIKENKENELISLIKYVGRHKNKKIIMNSRITIYNEAKEHNELFSDFFEEKDKLIKCIDMNGLTMEEKGRILFNHLYFKGIPKDYYNNILQNKAYKKIVVHKNYCPRLMEFVTKEIHYKNVLPEDYSNYIMKCLDNPNEVWKSEYNDRIKKEDRILLTTMFSLTDTLVKYNILQRAYNARVKELSGLDITQNIYENSLKRLNGSMIKLVDKGNEKWVGAVNPSVNDFLRKNIYNNNLEQEDIRKHCTEYAQILKMFPNSFEEYIYSGQAEKLNYKSEREKYASILSYICKNKVLNQNCRRIIKSYLKELLPFQAEDGWSYIEAVCILMSDEMNTFYSVKESICKTDFIRMIGDMEYVDLSKLLKGLKKYEVILNDSELINIIATRANESILDYCKNVEGENYYEEYDVKDLIESCVIENEIDYNLAHKYVEQYIIEDINEEIKKDFDDISEEFCGKILSEVKKNDFEIDLSCLDGYLDSQLEPMEPDYDDYYDDYYSSYDGADVLDYIFREGAI